jgi:DNA-binding MarR family transcriptional regulator
VLTRAGYRVIALDHADALAATARRHKDVVLVVAGAQDPAAQHQIDRQLAMLRAERPWLEHLPLTGPRGGEPQDFLTAIAEAFNLARLQQVQAGARRSLEQALHDYKARIDTAYAQLLSQIHGAPQPMPMAAAQAEPPMPDEIARLVADERARARIRERLFGPLALGHAGWLLVLALADASDGELTVKSAAHTAGLPLSSALRKINELCDRRLLTRRRDTSDARRSFVRLTGRMQAALRDYFAAVDAGHRR